MRIERISAYHRFGQMLPREERRELARGPGGENRPLGQAIDIAEVHLGHQNGAAGGARRCPYCTAPLTNGAPVCDATCDEGWWDVVPTVTGELWETLRSPCDHAEPQAAPEHDHERGEQDDRVPKGPAVGDAPEHACAP
jgi:hypothetical protein